MQTTDHLTLDIHRNDQIHCIYAKQHDNGMRKVIITLTDNNKSISIPSSYKAVLRCTKPDGYCVLNPCTISNNQIHITLTSQTLSSYGRVQADVALYQNNENLLSSALFYIQVEPCGYHEHKLSSSHEFKLLMNLLKEVEGKKKAIDQLSASMQALNQNMTKDFANMKKEATMLIQQMQYIITNT